MLERKKKYLQIALNSTLGDARTIISSLPPSDRIILEAGTPLIKSFGISVISDFKNWWRMYVSSDIEPYVVADMKTMDRGETEVALVRDAGGSAIIGLGQAPIETINAFVDACTKYEIDSMLDMMNATEPVKVLRQLSHLPDVVVLHRGVDEEVFNKSKPIPYIQINKIRASYDVRIAVAGGDTIREVQRAVFNDADIVIVWKEFYKTSEATGGLAKQFLDAIK